MIESPETGHSTAIEAMEAIDKNGRPRRTKDATAFEPRLLSLTEAGRYLSVSYWQVRDYVLSGVVPHVSLPCSFVQVRKAGKVYRSPAPPGTTIKRILVDRRDLDVLI